MKLIHDLINAPSSYTQEKLLKAVTFEEWQTFVAAYDPYSMYHLKFKDFDMDDLGEPNKMMFNLLERLTSRELSGTAARNAVEKHADVFGDLIKLVCNKDLRCGVSAKTFNKVHPGSIPKFEVQLAKEVPIETLSYPKVAQIKYDGVRLIIINNEGVVEFKTRNGKLVNMPKLREQLQKSNIVNYIIDTEVVYLDGKQAGRTSISGAINSAMHGGAIDESNIVFQAFDCMPLKDWQDTKCTTQYHKRWEGLTSLLEALQVPAIQLAYSVEVDSPDDVRLFYDVVLEQGYEGLILKDANHKYTFKRSKDWVKVKETKTADLVCTGWKNGDGKYEGLVGALTLEGLVEGKTVKVDVGSGLTDADRARAFRGDDGEWYTDYYVGNIIEVKYNTVIQDSKTGKWSLFLPRFVCVRSDK